jgi:hypothetical protein
MKMPDWVQKKWFSLSSGFLLMIPVLLIARTSLFYLCYVPLIFGAFVLAFDREKRNRWRQAGEFSIGMAICEILFGAALFFAQKIDFSGESSADWQVLGIELILGLLIFFLFYGAFLFIRFLSRNLR